MPWSKLSLSSDEPDANAGHAGTHVLTYAEALQEAHYQLLASCPDVFLMGEGINDVNGVFGSTKGLATSFPGRVFDCPISENALTGICAGAAATGLRPIFIHMRSDFLLMSMDQIVNHAAKWHYMTNGQIRIPLVIRSITGQGWGSAAQHSQGLHGLFMHIPGLKIAVPATPYDAKGLLMQASRDGNPVLFFEHRLLYNKKGHVPKDAVYIPFGQAVIRNAGTDITVVAVSNMLYEAMNAAEYVEKKGISVEIIDPRTLHPLDMETIRASVAKTKRLLVADCACTVGGFSAEILARIAESGIQLKSPPVRIGFPFVPTPASPVLEAAFYPNAQTIEKTIKSMIA